MAKVLVGELSYSARDLNNNARLETIGQLRVSLRLYISGH